MKKSEIIEELQKRQLDSSGRRVVQLERLLDALLPKGTHRPQNRHEYKEELKKRGVKCSGDRFVMLEVLVEVLTGRKTAYEKDKNTENLKKTDLKNGQQEIDNKTVEHKKEKCDDNEKKDDLKEVQ